MNPIIARFVMAAIAAAAVTISTSQAQIYVTDASVGTINVYHTNGAPLSMGLISGLSAPRGLVVDGSVLYYLDALGTVKKYSTAGAPINLSLCTVTGPGGMALCSGFLYIGYNGNLVGQYTTLGATQNATFLQFLSAPWYLASDGADLYVPESNGGRVGKYTVPGGILASFNPSLVSVTFPGGVAASGGYLYVAEYVNNVIDKYTTAGALVQASFITGLSGPGDLAVVDGALYVYNESSGAVGKYNAATGAVIDAALIRGPANAVGALAVVSETASVAIKGKKKIKTTAAIRIVKGTSIAAEKVEVRVGTHRYKKAVGTATWTFTAKLKPGRNKISVRATGANGIASPVTKIAITRLVTL
ncbi:MAG: hypothetical protein ACREKL_11480 [Chthoniobacterales bacterium]